MQQVLNGKEIMPNLKRIAQSNLFFSNTIAAGTKSCQALPAIFSGLPPQTYLNLLWQIPFVNVKGFPNILSLAGYETIYFHGGDLSFEHQREFLTSVGFNNIFEYDPIKPFKVYGWGYDDRIMFKILRNWIKQHRKEHKFSPYLASLFTLSSHDPYVLPEYWKPVFSSAKPIIRNDDWDSIFRKINKEEAIIESYHFLDQYLGEFYQWYKKEEMQKRTILVIIGDQTLHLANERHHSRNRHLRFHVPLIIAGLNNEEIAKYRDYEKRLAAMHDFSATIMPLLDFLPNNCDQGINLLSPQSLWPDERMIYSVDGNDLGRVYFWKNHSQARYDRGQNRLEIDFETKDRNNRNQVQKLITEVKNFIKIILPLNKYLIEKDAYFPKSYKVPQEIQALPRVIKPIFASHRGNTTGPGGDLNLENSEKAIKQAIASGFDWVEIDVQITKDGIPILMHDGEIMVGDKIQQIRMLDFKSLKQVHSHVMPLKKAIEKYGEKINMLIDVKGQSFISSSLSLGRVISNIVKEKKSNKRIIVNSLDSQLISSIDIQCKCETAFDTPFKEQVNDEWLFFAKRIGMEWIYVHYSVINKDLIMLAHKYGLKVMAYTVNDYDIILSWGDELPDGIITDTVEIKNKWERKKDI